MPENMKRETPKSIFLTGFMATGKSTVGRLLADLLECPFADFDERIVQRENHTIAEIFAEKGEGYFRDCETVLLNELFQSPMTVYATGGGLVVRDENRRLMANLGLIVYLHSSWPVLQKRLQQSIERPLVNSASGWDDLRVLWTQRQPFYEEADIIVKTDGLNPLQIAQKIDLELLL
jgi:shikimate kinase